MTADDAAFVARCRERLGAEGVATGTAAHAFAVDGLVPRCVVYPRTIDDVSDCMAAAGEVRLAVIPAGSGTQLGVGNPPHRYDVALSTRGVRRILAHEAGDMTVTVEAGLTLAELNAALAASGQWLPLDPPRPEQMTIGALIATDACGPSRLSQGKVRDLLIGITAVLADGRVVKGGGRVVKNVAGYDLMKLFAGSFGTLAVIAQATFKVRPRPEHETVFIIPAPSTAAAVGVALDVLAAPVNPLYLETLNRAAARQALGIDAAIVAVGCAGSVEELDGERGHLQSLARASLREFAGADALRVGTALRDFTARDSSEDVFGCKLSVLPAVLGEVLTRIEDDAVRLGLACALLAHTGNGIAFVRCTTAANRDQTFLNLAERARALVREAGGWAVVDRAPITLKRGIDVWGDEAPGFALMRGIKQTLDPQGLLSPGRFVGGL